MRSEIIHPNAALAQAFNKNSLFPSFRTIFFLQFDLIWFDSISLQLSFSLLRRIIFAYFSILYLRSKLKSSFSFWLFCARKEKWVEKQMPATKWMGKRAYRLNLMQINLMSHIFFDNTKVIFSVLTFFNISRLLGRKTHCELAFRFFAEQPQWFLFLIKFANIHLK